MIGEHQRNNIAAAICCVEGLQDHGAAVVHEAIFKGCQEIIWPGRMEIIKRDRLYLLDSAHNRSSARYLSETIQRIFSNRKIILVLGLSQGKDKRGICQELDKIVDQVFVTKTKHPRSDQIQLDEALQLFPQKLCEVRNSVEEVFSGLDECSKESLILFTGSIFLVAEARRFLG